MGKAEPAWLRYHGEAVKYAPEYERRVLECIDNGEGVDYVVVGYDDGFGCYDRSARLLFTLTVPRGTTVDALKAFATAVIRNCVGLYGPNSDDLNGSGVGR